MLKQIWTLFIAALVVAGINTAATSSAEAAPIRTALSIVIDGSGSISPADFATQKSAYATVLGNLVPLDGTVVLNVVQFSFGAQLEQSAIRINVQADLDAVIASINSMTQLNSLTAVGDGINLGVSNMELALAGFAAGEFANDFEKLVDVSTDGFNNAGANPVTASASANALGYKINCLGIGAFADCSFNNGFGDDFLATTFAQIEAVLEQKIKEELRIDVPAPATILLLGAGLFGLGLMRRRRAA